MRPYFHSIVIGGILALMAAGLSDLNAGISFPFPMGSSMGTLGAIIDARGASGRQPWIGAAFFDDASRYGFAANGVSYYGAMDNMRERDSYRAAGGAWYACHAITCKASIAYFNAWKILYEQTAFLSVGTRMLPFVHLSADLRGSRMGCAGFSNHLTIAEAGIAAWAPWSWAAVSFDAEHLILEKANAQGAESPLELRVGFHMTNNRFGGQGMLITITPDESRPVCCTVGEEYRLAPAIAFHAALSNNPVLLGFGVAFSLGRSNAGVALVNHSVLGWSQGFWADYYRK